MDEKTLTVMDQPKEPEVPRLKLLVDKAVNAVSDIIAEMVNSPSPSRFADAARYCSVGQSLIRANASRVDDFAVMEPEDGQQQQRAPRAAFLNGGGHLDERELQRNFMLTFGPNAAVNAEAQRATVAAQEAAELQTLTNIRNNLPVAQHRQVEARIATLLEHMESRNHANNPDAAEPEPEPLVADPVVPRGHQLGDGGEGQDAPPGLPAHGGGGEGNGVVAVACRIPEAVAG